jgi:hypothetical protein
MAWSIIERFSMSTKFKLLALFSLPILVLGLMIPTSGQASTYTQTFTPEADAYIDQSYSNTNYGLTTTLWVDNSPINRSYLRFNVSGLDGYTVSSAVLKLYANSSLSAGVSVNQESNSTWQETSITYNNAPAPGAAIKNSGAITSGSWASIDITPYITGNGIYSLVLTPLSGTRLNLASRESGSHAPQLLLTLASSSGATPTGTLPAGTQTPTPTGAAPTATPTQGGGSGQVPNFSHVIVMVFENREYSSVIGSSSWPHLNALANQYASLTKYYAVAHPSLPNYIAMTSGDTQDITSDCSSCYVNATNIVDSIEESGRSLRAYMESMPSACYTGSSSGKYVKRHNPFLYYNDIRNDTTRCQNDVVPLTQLDDDLSENHLPEYAWITPNLCNDGHDCSNSTADNFINTETAKILASPAFNSNSLLVITFDEGSSSSSCCGLPSSAGGHIATVLISSLVKTGFQDTTPYSHYSLLKTVEKAWGLPYLVHAGNSATTLITSPWK